MDELTAFYWDLFTQNPGLPLIRAVSAGVEHFGRDFDSPTLDDHRAAITRARLSLDDSSSHRPDPEES